MKKSRFSTNQPVKILKEYENGKPTLGVSAVADNFHANADEITRSKTRHNTVH